MLQALHIASSFGIATLNQLDFFVEVLKNENSRKSIMEYSVVTSAHDDKYKYFLGIFRKLANGPKYRDYNGIYLLEYKETGFNRRIGLTRQGEKLRQKLIDIGMTF